ncbi:unnamed protein product [Cylicocyclus nassatus]|uniref:Uncharacterized protein n=1 Tax=Cylicocyclus nassatus TaxID=53992 RepID=A0AA36GX40_CYLNA|nr:unnamed protein product [Cylicocyclus nassatus]
MDILKTHFDDKVTMRHILYTELAQLPNCDPEGRNLLTLYNRMFALIRQFSVNNDDSQETALGAILLNKLPARVRSRIYDKTANDHNLFPTELLHLLTDIVRKDITLYEMNFHSKTSNTEQSPYVSFNTSKYQKNTKRSRTQQQMKPSPYCEQVNHSAVSCDVFPTPYHRNRRAKEQRLCYNCLSKYHSTKECTSKRSCKYCKQRHHTSMCFSQPQQQLQQRPQTDTRNRRNDKLHKPRTYPERQHCANVTVEEAPISTPVLESSENTTPITITCSSTSPPDQQPKPRVALMCATVNLYNPSNASLRDLEKTAEQLMYTLYRKAEKRFSAQVHQQTETKH